MFSFKNSIRKTIALTLAATMTTTFFVWCSKSEQGTDPVVITTSITETTPDVIDTTPGVEYDISNDLLFHWVEEVAGSSLAVSVADFLAQAAANDTDTETETAYGLPVVSKDDTKYVHAGNLALPLAADGTFASEQDVMLLRYAHDADSAGGAKIYLYKDATKSLVNQTTLESDEALLSRTDKFWAALGDKVPPNHAEYAVAAALAENTTEICDNTSIWYNGIATNFKASGQMIPLDTFTADFANILKYEVKDGVYTFTLYTGIGEVTVTATPTINSYMFEYTLPENCTIKRHSIELDLDSITVQNGQVYVSPTVLTEVFNYFIFSFSSIDTGDGNTEDIAVVITDNQDILKSNKEAREAAEQKAQEQQAILDAHTLTDEEAEKVQKDLQNRQEMTEDTAAYTTEGIPLTASGGLTAPAKPTASYKLPANAQLNFTGDAASAEITELPEGCFWVPGAYNSRNAFQDPAGNIWLNNTPPATTGAWGRINGYYDSRGVYHSSLAEIDHYAAIQAADQYIADHGPSNFKDAHISDEDADELWNLRH